jgi:hypothetical protein
MLVPKAVSAVASGRQCLSCSVGSPNGSPSKTRPYMAAIIAMAVLAASACALGPDATPGSAAVITAPAAYDRGRLVGRWGVASFHADKDQKRTEAEAKAQCSQPYTIKLGPTDGVLMHVADDPTVHELRLKGDSAGKTYLGFEAPPRDPQDREILSMSDRMMTMRFVDPDANSRYGTFIYARCG